MAQVLTFAVLSFLFLQLAAGQDACRDAPQQQDLAFDDDNCTICTEYCYYLYEDTIERCPDVSSYCTY